MFVSFFIVYSIVRFFFTNAYGGERKVGEGWKSILFLMGCGCVVGVFAISLGIGGGMMLAPLLAYYLGYSSKQIVPISLFFVIFSSVSGFTFVPSSVIVIPFTVTSPFCMYSSHFLLPSIKPYFI